MGKGNKSVYIYLLQIVKLITEAMFFFLFCFVLNKCLSLQGAKF